MFRRAYIPIYILAAALCAIPPVLGDAATPIAKLALQPGDMPPAAGSGSPTPMNDADSLAALAPYGVREGVDYWYSWPIDGVSKPSSDSLPKGWQLSGELFRASDENGAKRLFALGKKAGGLSSSYLGDGTRILDLPRYGDEQFARVSRRASLESLVLVRKGTVVWEIAVKPMLAFEPTEAQLVAVLQTYAAKQKARIEATH